MRKKIELSLQVFLHTSMILHPRSIVFTSKNLKRKMLTLLIISCLCGVKPNQLKEMLMRQFQFRQEKLILTISLILFMVIGGAA